MKGLVQDIRHGARLLWRAPGFTAVGILSLAIGVGGGAAMFSVLNAAVYRPLPGHDTAAVQAIYTSSREGGQYGSTSFADFQSFTNAPGLFAASCATRNVKANIVSGDVTHVAAGAIMSGGCFETFRVRAAAGRLLTSSDDTTSAETPGIVISHALWARVFNRDPGVVGRAVFVSNTPAVIVGVAEAGFAGVSLDGGAEFFAPASLTPVLLGPTALGGRGERQFHVYARLDDRITSAVAQDRLNAVAGDA